MMSRRKSRIKPVEDAKSNILSSRDKPWFAERFVSNIKGRGVFATEQIEQGSFVLEYRGEFISVEECRSRHYSDLQSTFLYEFEWQKRKWCIDASKEDGSLGRLVNDNHKSPNCIMKKVIVNRPHLCLFAVKKIEIGTELDYNYGDSKWPWRKKAASKKLPAVAGKSSPFPTVLTSHEDLQRDDAGAQVTYKQAPEVEEETTVLPLNMCSPAGDVDDGPKVTYEQAPEVEEETTVLPLNMCSPAGDVDNGPKVTYEQAPEVEEETTVLPLYVFSHGADVDAGPKVTYEQPPEVEEETTLLPFFMFSHGEGVVAGPKVTYEQASEVEEETGEFPLNLCTHGEDEDTGPKEFTVKRTVLVDYSDTGESDGSCLNDQPLGPNQAEVVPRLRRTKSILMKTVPDFSDALFDTSDDSIEGPSTQPMSEMASQRMDTLQDFCQPCGDSNESIVEETEDEDSTKDHSNVQFDIEGVPKLRTKSFQMKMVPDFSDAFYSSDDSTDGPSAQSKSELASQRPRRGCYHPIQKIPVGSDVSSVDSGEEYIPGPMEESTDSEGSLEIPLQNKNINKVTTRPKGCKSSSKDRLKSFRQSNFKSSGQSSFKSSSQKFKSSSQFESSSQSTSFATSTSPAESTCMNEETEEQTGTDEDASVYVNPVLKKEDGSRLYNKKHRCFYCKKVVQKMSRHLLRMHSNETEVAKAFSLPKSSKERRLHLDYIRNKGNFEHNTEVLESRKGKLIPCKQPKKKTEGEEFLHCAYCYGLFTRRVMWRHFQACKFKPHDKRSKPGKTRVQALCAFAEPVPAGFSESYWMFLKDMNQDKIAIAVKQDSCILEYGYRLFRKNETVISQHQYIRQKMRELGRLILAAKKVAPVTSIKELIKPEKYAHVVTAARCLAGFSDTTGKYKCPSLARKVGHSLHALAMFVKSEALKARDKETVQNAEEFAQLYQESWKFDIASQALTQLDQSKWNCPQLLPFTQDVQTLHSQLCEKQQQHLDALKEEVSPSNWKDLAKVTLAQIILFNRRREGEVSKMPLSVFLSRDQSETHEDINLALTELEQKLCKHFVRITIVGKRGRKVPVLLTPLMKESLDTLVEKREECGVLDENVYLFALPHSVHHLRGSDCIRQLVHECRDIKNPKALTSTKLRKHIATLSTVLNLKNTELDQLADFLGHNIAVHRKHYRLPEGTLQLAKISKVLLALEQGQLGKYKGKSLDEIHIDPNETVEIEARSLEDMEDASMAEAQESEDETSTTSHQGSTIAQNQRRKLVKKRGASITETHESEGEDSVTSLPDSSEKTTDTNMAEAQESDDGASTTSMQECTSTASARNQRRTFSKKRGKQATVKRSWTPEESAAAQRHLKRFIVMKQVPGKEDCQHCIDSEPEALQNRDWRAVKYFIKNRIASLRRKIE